MTYLKNGFAVVYLARANEGDTCHMLCHLHLCGFLRFFREIVPIHSISPRLAHSLPRPNVREAAVPTRHNVQFLHLHCAYSHEPL